MHIFEKLDIKVYDAFIQKFAEKYLEQRSQAQTDVSTINEHALFKNLGFGTEVLRKIFNKNAIPFDPQREQGLQPAVLNDIYRSDLGELLMTYYFEEKIPEGQRFVIPLKNITFRELPELPGRGLDAIGYKYSEDKVEILLGEAKVSADRKSPPAVVDINHDSLYKTQMKHKNDVPMVIRRLSNYEKRLNLPDASIIGFAILCLERKLTDKCTVTYGCTLIRDYACVNETSDFGKLKSNVTDFEPGKVHFSILSFSNKSIEETVDLFYRKIQELIA